jgi:hypothetical protein
MAHGERLWRVGQRRADFPGRITDSPGRITDARGGGSWHAPSMGMLPKLSESDLVRTDFTDSTAWEQASRPALTAPIAGRRGA